MSKSTDKRSLGIPLWVPVTLAFILLIAAWTTLIIIAKNHPPDFIPVETSSSGENLDHEAQR